MDLQVVPAGYVGELPFWDTRASEADMNNFINKKHKTAPCSSPGVIQVPGRPEMHPCSYKAPGYCFKTRRDRKLAMRDKLLARYLETYGV